MQVYLPNNPNTIFLRTTAAVDKIVDKVEQAANQGRAAYIQGNDGWLFIPREILGSCVFAFRTEDDE